MDRDRLRKKALIYELELNDQVLDNCAEYAQLVIEWNDKFNITAITDAEEMEDKHFIDSLFLASQNEIHGRVVDVGTGGGFPGLILKLYRPDIELTLIESNKKKIAFLRHACAHFGLDVALNEDRAEEVARTNLRESFDLVTARAVSALPILSELCLPLVKPGGWFIPMKGRNNDEYIASQAAIKKLGGLCLQEKPYHLPDGSARKLFYIKKEKPTESKYPRSMSQIKKNPL